MRASSSEVCPGCDGDGRRAVVRLRGYRRQHGWTCPQLTTLFCSADQGARHMCALFSRESLDMCTTDNRP